MFKMILLPAPLPYQPKIQLRIDESRGFLCLSGGSVNSLCSIFNQIITCESRFRCKRLRRKFIYCISSNNKRAYSCQTLRESIKKLFFFLSRWILIRFLNKYGYKSKEYVCHSNMIEVNSHTVCFLVHESTFKSFENNFISFFLRLQNNVLYLYLLTFLCQHSTARIKENFYQSL